MIVTELSKGKCPERQRLPGGKCSIANKVTVVKNVKEDR